MERKLLVVGGKLAVGYMRWPGEPGEPGRNCRMLMPC